MRTLALKNDIKGKRAREGRRKLSGVNTANYKRWEGGEKIKKENKNLREMRTARLVEASK